MMHGVSRKCKKKNNQNIIKAITFVANFVKPKIQIMTGPSVSSKFWLG